MKTSQYRSYYTKICEAIRYCERQIIRDIFVFWGKAEHEIFVRLLQNILIVDSGERINVFMGSKHASCKKVASLLSAWSPDTNVIVSCKNL